MKYSNAKGENYLRLNYTKLFALKSVLIFLLTAHAQDTSIKPKSEPLVVAPAEVIVGAERFDSYAAFIKGKRIAVVGNQSSLIDSLHLVDTLLSLKYNVVKVFSPEHGFRGKADAGAYVSDQHDEKTGLPIISLYGSNRKPTNEQLQGVDVVLFDIQDVGVRFYTYISTMHYIMEACAENSIPVVILDRPNPNGHYVDGPVLDPDFTSFIGMHEVPIVHGMTIGEYALMVNGECWLKDSLSCDLTVISCENYRHDKPYHLAVPPSPNLQSDLSVQLYPSLCLLEATTVSIGRGTDHPFEQYGHPNFPITGYSFTPKPMQGAMEPKLVNETCNGYLLLDTAYHRMTKLDLSFLINTYQLLSEAQTEFLFSPRTFELLCGNDDLLQQLKDGCSEDEMRDSWEPALSEFKKLRKKYLIYP